MRVIRTAPLSLLAFGLMVAAGCGASKGDLTGTVTNKGKPLKGGQVLVQAASGEVVAGGIGEDGRYTVPGIPTGPAKVAVSYTDNSQVEYFKAMSAQSRGATDGKTLPPPKGSPNAGLVDQKYSEFGLSGLSTTIGSGSNKYDIDLK